MIKVLVVGPSDRKSRGGMATVVSGIRNSNILNKKFQIAIHESYVDSNILIRIIFSIFSYAKYLMIVAKYDLIHVHMATRGSTYRKMAYARAAQKKGIKVIVHIHGADFPEFVDGLSIHKQNRIKAFLQGADMVIGLSDEWKERLSRLYDLKNCVSLPNGIDTDEFANALSIPADYRNSFALLGRIGERKGVYDLIKAAKKAVIINPKIKIILAGDGEIEKAKKMVNENKLDKNVFVVGWIDFKQKIEILKSVSTVVLPSYFEGLPMSILEGMAAGKAIISSNVGAIPEVVKEENGILVDPGNVEAIANALVACSQNVELIETFSKNNIEKIDKEFSMKIMHDKLASFYASVLMGE